MRFLLAVGRLFLPVLLVCPPFGASASAPSLAVHVLAATPGSRPAPLHATDISGKPLSLDSYRGRVVLLDYWTTGCPMCRPEQANVLRSYESLHSEGLEVIGISLDDRLTTAALRHYIKEQGYPWRQIHDSRGWDSPLAAPYQLDSLPFLLLIGRDGKIAAVNPQGEALQPALLKALAATPVQVASKPGS